MEIAYSKPAITNIPSATASSNVFSVNCVNITQSNTIHALQRTAVTTVRLKLLLGGAGVFSGLGADEVCL